MFKASTSSSVDIQEGHDSIGADSSRGDMRKDQMKGEQRLMGANEAAKYFGLSYWTLRELIWSGAIPLVRLPNKSGGRMREILVDKVDLDRLIDQSKETITLNRTQLLPD